MTIERNEVETNLSALGVPALEVFELWLASFADVVDRHDAAAFADEFTAEAYWRDILSFTWEHRTFGGRDQIRTAYAQSVDRVRPTRVRLAPHRSAPRSLKRSGRTLIEGYFDFDTSVGSGAAFVRLALDDDTRHPKVLLLLTTQHDLTGHEERYGDQRPRGDEYSQIASPISWGQQRERESAFADREPQVVIVGAGQGGLMLAARLKQMRVDALVVERTQRVGDGWRRRYNNLTLHNEVFANHFPYFPFPSTWPLWLPKDMLANWLESYAELLELNVWTSTQLRDAVHDDDAGEWTFTLDRAGHAPRTMRCRHLVVATGVAGGPPNRPQIPGLDEFSGTVVHSSEFTIGAEWAGKNAIVIGTGNSGHDVAQDLFVSGAAVTMVQRSATNVVSLDPSAKIHYAVFDEGRPVEDVDLMAASTPYPTMIDSYKRVTRRMRDLDTTMLEGLDAVGFKTWDGEDGTGFQLLYLRTGGGYYIDVGCCQLLIDRKIALAQAADMDRFVVDGMRMHDGSIVPADVVVLATGFAGMQQTIRAMLGDVIADRLGPVWGFDQDHVMANMWRRTEQEGLWLMGGAITEARLQSRFLAVEICAAVNGLLPPRSAMPLVSR